MSTSTSANDKARPQPVTPLLPPEEQFWKRYSPHQEAPLAGPGSFLIPLLAIGILVLSAFSLVRFFRPSRSLPVDAVRLNLGGGGGKPTGEGNAPGIGHGPEDVDPKDKN